MTGSTERILHLTPQSHFSRKVRIVLQELGLPCELAHVPDLLSDDPAKFGGNPILSLGHNLASDATCNLTGTGDLPSNASAGLGPLANNGGPALPGPTTLFTRAITTASAAYGAGDCATVPLTTDERGGPRKLKCDAGAFELPCTLRGDANDSAAVSVQDVFYLINNLFAGGPAASVPCRADVNGDGHAAVTDVFYLINYLFAGGSAPPP